MNKISKKIVSLVTVAAFATTLVPAAAFAAPVGESTVDATLVGGNQTIVLNSSDEATATINVDLGNVTLTDNTSELAIWAGTTASTKEGIKSVSANTPSENAEKASGWGESWWLDEQTADFTATVTFEAAGEYPLYVGYWTVDDKDITMLDSVQVGTVTVKDATDATTTASKIFADGTKTAVEGTVDDTTVISFDVNQNGGAETAAPLNNPGETVYLWAEDATTGKMTNAVTFDSKKATQTGYVWAVNGNVYNGDEITATLKSAGKYVIKAAVTSAAIQNQNADTVATVFANTDAVKTLSNSITADIKAKAVKTTAIMVDSVTDADRTASSADTNNNRHEEFTIKDDVTPSATKVYTVKGVAYVDAEKNIEAANEVLEVSADDGLTLGGLTDGTVTTGARGEFSFTFTMEDAAKYDITITEANDDAKTVVTVIQDDVDAVDIAVEKEGGKVLAGTDRKYASQVFDGSVLLSDAVQFSITDAYGRDAMGPGPIKDEAAANKTNHADSLSVVKQPEKDKVSADDFYLAWDEDAGVYTLEYTGAAKNLVAGDYTVRVALNNGGKQVVEVDFTAVEFGEVQELVLDMSAAEKKWWDNTNQNNAITAIDDQVALGQWVKVVPKYVDENGLKVTANAAKMQVGINGDAVVNREVNGQNIGFATADNSAANNALVGSTITVKVNDASLGAIGYVEKELTVVKNYLAETVTMDPVQGVVGESNTATVSVVDENGNVSKVNGTLTATVVAQSDETANVDLKANPQVKNGKASLYLESDKAGTADVRLVVEAANGELYADTITYTFGDEDPYAGSYVVMTIGASDYLINGSVVEGDGAPYVDDAWRTMVPFRVLGEAFGAEVEWNQDAQSVTYTVGETELVMTIGEDTYTLNGEEQTMDTAPVLSGDRTYVPVRFVAEDLGFEVTPLYDATTGATASVVFQK